MVVTSLHALTSLVIWMLLGCGPGSSEPPASASAQGSQEKPAAAPQEKDVAATGDPAIDAIDKFIAEQKIDKSKAGWKTRLAKPPQVTFDPKKDYYWVVETNVGSFKIRLFPDNAPLHVSSYLYLTALGYYDGIAFHRVVKGFMAQGGDPLGNGRGGPGYKMDYEGKPGLTHKTGILSTANAGRNTDGSQFFLMFRPVPQLDGSYTIVGEMTEGADTTLKELEKRGTTPDRDPPGTPVESLSIKSAKIEIKDKQ